MIKYYRLIGIYRETNYLSLSFLGGCKVKSSGGNANQACCVFPFRYKGKSYHSCTTLNYNNRPWCSTTSNYDTDKKWGKCIG